MNTLTKCRAITLVRPNEQRATLTLFPHMPLVHHQKVSEIGLSKIMQSELYDFGVDIEFHDTEYGEYVIRTLLGQLHLFSLLPRFPLCV